MYVYPSILVYIIFTNLQLHIWAIFLTTLNLDFLTCKIEGAYV